MPAFDLQKLLREVFSPEPGETVVILADLPHGRIPDSPDWEERRRMAEEWLAAFEKLGLRVQPLLTYFATGSHNAELPERGVVGTKAAFVREVLGQCDIAVAMTEFSATATLAACVHAGKGRLRAASMPGVVRRMEETALAADYAQIAVRANALADRLTRADSAEVVFSTGHKATFDLRFRKAHADDGVCTRRRENAVINLPGGEAYIVPYEGEREGEASRTSGEIPTQWGCQLVILKVGGNRIQTVEGEGRLAETMRAYFAIDPARCNVAELGLGCNDRAVVTGRVIEDEKAGMHWAYGRSEHLGGTVGPGAFAKPEYVVHSDVVYGRDCPIGVTRLELHYPDGSAEEIMRDNRYVIF